MEKYKSRSSTFFIETPLGIVTRTGDWFHTTAEQIEQFVPGLLQKISLGRLVGEANAWVRSADSLSMSLVLVLLMFINPVLAAAITVAFHFFWYRLKSGFVIVSLGRVFKYMNTDAYMLIVSLIILSLLGMSGQYTALAVGLVFFFLTKPALLKRLWDLLDKSSSAELSLNDRVFKMLLIRYSMKYGLEPAEVTKIENRFLELANSRKKDSDT